MKSFFYLGWLFLVAAFGAASIEAVTSGPGLYMSAHDLWQALSAKHFVITQIRVERMSLALWDPVLTSILAFPAWMLLGLPGTLLTWYCRPGRILTEAEKEDHRNHTDSVFLYDELAKEAKRLGYDDSEDDLSPSHEGHDAIAAIDKHPIPTDQGMREDIQIDLEDNQTIDITLNPKIGADKDRSSN